MRGGFFTKFANLAHGAAWRTLAVLPAAAGTTTDNIIVPLSRRTVVSNDKKPPKIKIGKMTDHTYASNSLKRFGHAIKGNKNYVNLLKFA